MVTPLLLFESICILIPFNSKVYMHISNFSFMFLFIIYLFTCKIIYLQFYTDTLLTFSQKLFIDQYLADSSIY